MDKVLEGERDTKNPPFPAKERNCSNEDLIPRVPWGDGGWDAEGSLRL